MSEHYALAVENKFSNGQQATFTINMREGPNWVPTGYYIRNYTYDDTSGGAASSSPFIVKCQALGGALAVCVFQNSANVDVAPAHVQSSNLYITHTSGKVLKGDTLTFTCEQNGVALTNLNGRLAMIIEMVRKAPKKRLEERKTA